MTTTLWAALNSIGCAVNAAAFAAWGNPISLGVAVACGLIALIDIIKLGVQP